MSVTSLQVGLSLNHVMDERHHYKVEGFSLTSICDVTIGLHSCLHLPCHIKTQSCSLQENELSSVRRKVIHSSQKQLVKKQKNKNKSGFSAEDRFVGGNVGKGGDRDLTVIVVHGLFLINRKRGTKNNRQNYK